MTEQVVKGQCFECRVEDGYISDRVWGKISHQEAEQCTHTLIDMAKRVHTDKLLIDIQELAWINDLTLRLRGTELFFEGSKHFKHIALFSNRPAITYLVTLLAKGGGLDTKSFGDSASAAGWLRSR